VAALENSVHRITSIALVHETLTEEFEGAVDMADVARRVVRMLEGSLGREDVHIELHTASVRVDAAVATPLAVILNELIQNAIEHGVGDGQGTVTVRLHGGGDAPVVLQIQDNADRGTSPAPPPASGVPDGGTPEPPPPVSGAPDGGTPEPPPPVSGAPEREGSQGAYGAQPAVHSPGASPGASAGAGGGGASGVGAGRASGAGPGGASGTGVGGVPGTGGGLGLRLVRALVEEELNGQFTLTHLAGRGSIATATIPPVGREG
jgi:hypothetical protein